MGKGRLSSGIKRSARESNHSHLMSRFKNSGSYISYFVYLQGVQRDNFTFIFYREKIIPTENILTCDKNYGRKISTEHMGLKSQK